MFIYISKLSVFSIFYKKYGHLRSRNLTIGSKNDIKERILGVVKEKHYEKKR